MAYAFNKDKLPQGFSFPLKHSALDVALDGAGVAQVHSVYYRLRRSGNIVLRADYCGEANRAWAAGRSSITLYAVPASERRETEAILLQTALPQLCAWLQNAEQAGNVWRGVDHALVLHVKNGALVATAS